MIEYCSWVIKASYIIWPFFIGCQGFKCPREHFHNAKPKHKTKQTETSVICEDSINIYLSIVHICQRKVSMQCLKMWQPWNKEYYSIRLQGLMKCVFLRVGGGWPRKRGLRTAKLRQFWHWQPEILIGLIIMCHLDNESGKSFYLEY